MQILRHPRFGSGKIWMCRSWIVQNLDHAESGLCKILINHAILGSYKFLILQNLDSAWFLWVDIIFHLDCADFASSKIWIRQDLDCAEVGLFKFWIVQNLDFAEVGLCKIRTSQDLDHAKLGSCRIFASFYFHVQRPNIHCGLCFLSGNVDLFGLQHIIEWTEEGLCTSRCSVHKIIALYGNFRWSYSFHEPIIFEFVNFSFTYFATEVARSCTLQI